MELLGPKEKLSMTLDTTLMIWNLTSYSYQIQFGDENMVHCLDIKARTT